MSNFILIEAEGDHFYIEVLSVKGKTGVKERSRDSLTEKLTKDDFKQMIRRAVIPTCQTFVDVWQELNQPFMMDGAEVEFDLGFTASGSAVIVQASGQGSFKVKVTWKPADARRLEQASISGVKSGQGIVKALEALESQLVEAIKIHQESPEEQPSNLQMVEKIYDAVLQSKSLCNESKIY